MATREIRIKYTISNTGLKSIIPLGDHCPSKRSETSEITCELTRGNNLRL